MGCLAWVSGYEWTFLEFLGIIWGSGPSIGICTHDVWNHRPSHHCGMAHDVWKSMGKTMHGPSSGWTFVSLFPHECYAITPFLGFLDHFQTAPHLTMGTGIHLEIRTRNMDFNQRHVEMASWESSLVSFPAFNGSIIKLCHCSCNPEVFIAGKSK